MKLTSLDSGALNGLLFDLRAGLLAVVDGRTVTGLLLKDLQLIRLAIDSACLVAGLGAAYSLRPGDLREMAA